MTFSSFDQKILNFVQENGETSEAAISKKFDLCSTTIARYLLSLERKGKVERVYKRVGYCTKFWKAIKGGKLDWKNASS